jgi:hydroxypyruvate isomerase
MRFSVCIDAVFRDLGPQAALEQVKAAGLDTFEFWTWWDKDIDGLKKKADALVLNCATLCTRFVTLTDPGQREAYLAGLKESIAAAKKMGARTLISQVGNNTGAVRAFQHKAISAGLKAAAPLLEESGITLVIEPLNTRVDHGGYYLESSGEGFALIDEVGSGNIKLLFDIYHQQITEGDIIGHITPHIGKIGHFHAAGVPGRHELSTGELNYAHIFEAIDRLGYQGFMGLEYFPKGNALESLKALAVH